jgi:hypothetical protein
VQRIVPITTGQLLVRNTATRECALIGVVRLPHDVVIRENAAYLAMFLADSADLVDRPLDKGLPDELEGQGINAALRASVWRRTSVPGALTVRFIPARIEQNLWVVYGASDQPIPAALPGTDCGDVWLRCNAGRVAPMAAPASSRGETMAQMLTQHPVWPDAHGNLFSFPQHTPTWCAHYHRMSKLLARCGAGELTEAEMQCQLRADPHLDRIRPMRPEHRYLRFLAALDANDALHPAGPRGAVAHRAEETAASAIVRAQLAA